jgi:hypothetical protein
MVARQSGGLEVAGSSPAALTAKEEEFSREKLLIRLCDGEAIRPTETMATHVALCAAKDDT